MLLRKPWKRREELKGKGKLSCDKGPESYIPGRGTLTITICNSDGVTHLNTQQKLRRILTW